MSKVWWCRCPDRGARKLMDHFCCTFEFWGWLLGPAEYSVSAYGYLIRSGDASLRQYFHIFFQLSSSTYNPLIPVARVHSDGPFPGETRCSSDWVHSHSPHK